jgi:hypothetical protein
MNTDLLFLARTPFLAEGVNHTYYVDLPSQFYVRKIILDNDIYLFRKKNFVNPKLLKGQVARKIQGFSRKFEKASTLRTSSEVSHTSLPQELPLNFPRLWSRGQFLKDVLRRCFKFERGPKQNIR